MITLALLASLMVQDTNTVISPRVRAMLDRFPPPRPGQPSIAIRFSEDTVWIGEQVELVTGTWFPRQLRDQLKRGPAVSQPSLTGLWSARDQKQPIPATMRVVGNQMYDLFISWQTIFPLGSGRIEAPAATLTFNLPTSTAYFAPEERKTYHSGVATLVVRPIPPALVGTLGAGPTAHNLRIAWRSSASTLRAGAPEIVELAISGDGNLTLWPAPVIQWPDGVRIYPEPTLEHPVPAQGLISGEKHFRYTIVADSAGVLTLPAVRYPYFDPSSREVFVPVAPALTLAILQRPLAAGDRRSLTVRGAAEVPLATSVVRTWWPVLSAIAICPLLLVAVRGRRRRPVITAAPLTDPELALRAALGTPVAAGESHVVAALRERGVPRDEAEHVHRWLSAVGRRRYGPSKADIPEPPPVLARVIARLRAGSTILVLLLAFAPLYAQQPDGVSRFGGGDFPGSARAFEAELATRPFAAGTWRDLGSARWMQRDDVGAAAAWLWALGLAPRDPLLRAAWEDAGTIPPDVRGFAPTIPLSRDELLLIALLLWLLVAVSFARRWRRVTWVAAAGCAGALLVAGLRWRTERPGQVLVASTTTLRISPHPATTGLGELPAWTMVHVERRLDNWVLVTGDLPVVGSGSRMSVQGWVPAKSVAPIGPLD